MSFWAGVVQGIKDVDVLKEKEALAEERKAASDKAEAWQLKNFEYTKSRNDAADAYRDRTEAENLRRYEEGVSTRAEELNLTRTIEMLKLAPGTVSAFSGMGGDVNSSDAPPPAGMKAAVLNLRAEVGGKQGLDNMDPKSQEFFNTLLGNPAAAAGVYSFIQAQRDKGNDLPISQLPSVIQIAGTMEASGEEAYKDFTERFAKGNVDMSNSEEYLAGMKALMGYKPAQVIWGQTAPVLGVTDQNAMYETFVMNTVGYGDAALSQMDRGSPEAQELLITLNNARKTGSENAAIRSEAIGQLWDMGYGREAASELKIDASNPRMKPFFARDNITPVAMSESPQAPQAPSVPEDTGMASVGAPMDSPVGSSARLTFATPAEAEAAIEAMDPAELSKIPSIVINGKVYANTEYVGEGESGMGTPALPDEQPVSRIPERQAEGFSESPVGLDIEATRTPSEPGIETPAGEQQVNIGGTSVLSSVVSDYEEAKGAPLAPEEELAVGIEAIVGALTGNGMDRGDLDTLIIELQTKYGDDRVREALDLAMNQE